MKRLLILFVALLGAGSFAFGQATTMPSAEVPWKVLITPFRIMGNTTGREWVAGAIQENLRAQLTGIPGLMPIDGQPINNGESDAIAAGKNAGAVLVVFGTCEIADNDLRAIGQVDDVYTGRVLTSLKATGPVGQLFAVEDNLSNQLSAALPHPEGYAATPQTNVPQEPPSPPQQTYVAPAPSYYGSGYAPQYSYYYGDPGYSYSEPYSYYYGGYPYYGPYLYGGIGFGYYGHGYGGFRGGFGGFRGGGFGGGFHGGGFGGGHGGGHGR
jgi:TolB-like protein